MPVTDQQARALAFLAAAARPHGASRWDEAGIVANILKVRDRSLAGVAIAVRQAAEDRKAMSPGVIPSEGPHWRDPGQAPAKTEPNTFDPASCCDVCSVRMDAHRADDHAFVSALDHTRKLAATADEERDRKQAAREYARQALGDSKAEKPTTPEPPAPAPHPAAVRARAAMSETSDA